MLGSCPASSAPRRQASSRMEPHFVPGRRRSLVVGVLVAGSAVLAVSTRRAGDHNRIGGHCGPMPAASRRDWPSGDGCSGLPL